jgi:hypothetical protein
MVNFGAVQISAPSQRGEEDVPMNHKFYGKLLETASKAGQRLSTSARSLHWSTWSGRRSCRGTEVMLSWPTNGSRKVRQQHPARLLSCKVYIGLLCLLPPVATSVIWHRCGMMMDVGNPPCIDHKIVDLVGKPMDFRNWSVTGSRKPWRSALQLHGGGLCQGASGWFPWHLCVPWYQWV